MRATTSRMAVVSLALSTLAVVWGNEAAAQEWDWQITPYLWTIGINGDARLGLLASDIDVSFSDIVDVAEGAAALHLEGGTENHGLFGDVVWLSLELDDELTTAGDAAEVQFDTTILELGYVLELEDFGVEFGVRYWDMELEINPVLIAAIERKQDWTDGFVGLRTTNALGDNWNLTLRANVGAGGSDFTYGMGVNFGRVFDSGNQFVVGFRALGVDYEEASVRGIPFNLDILALGATVGYAFAL